MGLVEEMRASGVREDVVVHALTKVPPRGGRAGQARLLDEMEASAVDGAVSAVAASAASGAAGRRPRTW